MKISSGWTCLVVGLMACGGGASPSATGAVEGQARLANATDHTGILVALEGSGQVATTGADGRFLFPLVMPGTYSLRATRSGYGAAASPVVNVTAGRTTTVAEVTLTGVVASVTGVARREGATEHGGVQVRLSGSEQTASTDATGAFRLDGVPPGTYVVTATAVGYSAAVSSPVLVAEAGSDVDAGVLVLRVGRGELAGTAVREGQSDHAGILVELAGASLATLTTASGAYVLTGVPAGQYAVVASSPGYATATANDQTVLGESRTEVPALTLAARPGRVEGRVVREGEASHAGTVVQLDGTAQTSVTDAAGAFAIPDVAAGSYTVTATYPLFETRASGLFAVAPAETELLPEIVLGVARGAMVGTVTLADASDHAGVLIEVLDTPHSTVTSAAGQYYLADVPVGARTVRATRDGYVTEAAPTVTVTQDDVVAVDPLVLDTDPGALTGQVSLEDGGDPQGVEVLLLGTAHRSLADASGAWSLTGLRAGSYLLETHVIGAESGRYAARQQWVTVVAGTTGEAADETLPLVRGQVVGTVTLEGQTMHGGVLVEIMEHPWSTTSGSSGEYALSGVPVGLYTVRLSASGFEPVEAPLVAVTAAAPHDLGPRELRLLRGDLTGQLRLAGESDHSGIAVEVLGTEHHTTTDATGHWSIGGVPVGLQELEASRPGYRSRRQLTVVRAHETAELPTEELEPFGGRVVGTVRLQGQTQHGGVEVRLNGTPYATTTDESGAFVLPVPPVTYTAGLVASKLRFHEARYEANIIVQPESAFDVRELSLEASHNDLSGQVLVYNRPDHGGVQVTVRGESGSEVEHEVHGVTTSAAGDYEVPLLPVGPYRVTYEYPVVAGYETYTEGSVRIQAGPPTVMAPRWLRDRYVVIEDYAAGTTIRNVTLALGAGDCDQMKVSNLPDLSDATWGPCSLTKTWELTAGDGTKRVYAQFLPRSAPTQPTDIVSDDIALDSTAAILGFTHNGGASPLRLGNVLHLRLTSNEPGRATAAIDGYEGGIELLDDGTHGDAVAGDRVYERDYVIAAVKDVTNARVTGTFVDTLSNSGNLDAVDRVTILVAPQIFDLTVLVSAATRTATITWRTDEAATGLVRWGTSVSYGTTTPGPGSGTTHSVTLTGLEAGVEYHYQVEASDAGGNTFALADRTFRLVPNRPFRVAAIPGLDRVHVRWEAQSTTGVSGYHVYRAEDPAGPWAKLTTDPYNHEVMVYRDEAVVADQPYWYRVRAVDDSTLMNESDDSEDASAIPGASLGPMQVQGVYPGVTVWSERQSPITVTGGVEIPAGSTLVIGPNVEVKVDGYYHFRILGEMVTVGERGTVDATGIESDAGMVVITSARPTPAPGDWRAIELQFETAGESVPAVLDLEEGRYLAGNLFYRTRVEYAGNSGIRTQNTGFALVRSKVQHCRAGLFGRDAHGGGLLVLSARILVSGSTITGNLASATNACSRGGGLYMNEGELLLIDSMVEGNEARCIGSGGAQGGGLLLGFVAATSPNTSRLLETAIIRSTIRNNSTSGPGGGYGGGLYILATVSDVGSILVQDSTLIGNSTGDKGGSAYVSVDKVGALAFVNSLVATNSTVYSAGGGVYSTSKPPRFVSTRFFGNRGGSSWPAHDLMDYQEVLGCTFEQDGSCAGQVVERYNFTPSPSPDTRFAWNHLIGSLGSGCCWILEPSCTAPGPIYQGNSFFMPPAAAGYSMRTQGSNLKPPVAARGNYWGESVTAELQDPLPPHPRNISPIYDHMDDINLATIDYADWAVTSFPMPRVTAPRWWRRYAAGEEVTFTGFAYDLEDAADAGCGTADPIEACPRGGPETCPAGCFLDDSQVEWRDDADTVLGYGNALTWSSTVSKTHRLWFVAYDSDGQMAKVPVEVIVP